MTADIDEIHRRLTLAVKERCDYLKSTVDNYLASELKNLKELHANLELEVTNIQVRRRHTVERILLTYLRILLTYRYLINHGL